MNSRKFKAFIAFNWHWYLVIVLLMVFVFYYLFTSLMAPAYNEKLVIFIGHNYVDEKKMSADLYKGFENTDILVLEIDYSNPKDKDYGVIFNTRGMVNTDLIIISDDYIQEGKYHTYFAEINTDDLRFEAAYFYDNDKVYGIDVTEVMKKYCDLGDEKYYLFLNKSSEKINDEALIVIKNLLGENE